MHSENQTSNQLNEHSYEQPSEQPSDQSNDQLSDQPNEPRETAKDQKICVIGLGYVGLTLASALADVGFEVHGVESKNEVLRSLNKGKAHFYEPGLDAQLKLNIEAGRLKLYNKIPHDTGSTVFVVTVGTPINEEKKVMLEMVESVAQEIAGVLKPGNLVIMRSTVKLRTTSDIVKPILMKANVEFDLAFCPERTLGGKALQELRQLPQIIGAETPECSVRAGLLFKKLTSTIVNVSSFEAAEMIKLIDNTQRDVLFAFANEVAGLCDVAGISAIEVIEAGKLAYPRTNIAMPGPVGGPCLEKDPYILAEGFEHHDASPRIALAARKTNEDLPLRVVRFLNETTKNISGFSKTPRIALLGLAFKGRPAIDDIRGSVAVPILKALREYFQKAEFVGYDAAIAADSFQRFELRRCHSLSEAFNGSNLVIILNNHIEFEQMDINQLALSMAEPGLIYDFWNNFKLENLHLRASNGYISLGSHRVGLLPGGTLDL